MFNLELELLSVQEAATMLRLAPRTVRHRIKTGTMAAYKVGGGHTSAYVIPASEVARLLAKAAAS